MSTRLVPYQEGMKLGFGYDLVSGTPLASPAVQGSVSSLQGAGGQQVESHLVRINDLDTLHQTLGVNVDAGGSYFGASTDVKVNYAKECNISQYSTHVFVGVTVVDAFENFDAPVLSPDAITLLTGNNNVRFRQRFGDLFLDGLQKGGEYYATFEIKSTDESTREDIAVHVEAAFTDVVAAAHLNTDIASSIARASSHTEVRVHVFQNGSIDPTDQDIQEILKKAHNFPPTVAGPLAVPFYVSITDYNTLQLPNDQFNFLDIQNQRDVLAEHARKRFAFLTLLNDIIYIRQQPQDFVDPDLNKLGTQLEQVTNAINVMEQEASACLRNPGACNFTTFDVSNFPLPPAKPIAAGGHPAPVNVPDDLIGQNVLVAAGRLIALGLKANPVHKFDDSHPGNDAGNVGNILSPVFPTGEVQAGTTINLFRRAVRTQMPDDTFLKLSSEFNIFEGNASSSD